MIVLDASAVVEILRGTSRGEEVARWFEGGEGRIHAPGLVDAEVAHALRRLVGLGAMSEGRGRASIEILQELPITRHPVRLLLPRVWALRHNLTAYDAAYVALAEALGCPLVTLDRRLATVRGLATRIVVPGPERG